MDAASARPVACDVVLVGGGHSHVAVLRRFGMRPLPGVRLTLVTRDLLTPYSGMLPGLVAGHYTPGEAHIDLQRLARFAGARVYHAAVTGLDLEAGLAHAAGRPPVPFDLLSIDIGSTPDLGAIAGAAEHALAVKPVDGFIARWTEVVAACRERGGALALTVIGGGAGGIELTLSLQQRLRAVLAAQGLPDRVAFTLVAEGERLLPTHAPVVGERLGRHLRRRGVRVLAGTRAVAVGPGWVRLGDGACIATDLTVAATHAAPAPWLAGTGLALDARGFVAVGPTLQSTSHPRVFASGDVASLAGHDLPKSGVYAVRQGPVLAENLRRAATGRRLRAYRPQPRTLALVSTGDRAAIASYGRLWAEGGWVWRAKDWIDRRWMRRYQELPRMGEPAPEEGAGAALMRCGGCGSKVASAVLRRVLERLGASAHADVVIGLAGADDAAVISVPAGKLLVQSVDHFRTFIDDPYLFARVTANHCLSDLFAMGAAPHTAQALVSLPFGPEAKVESDLLLVLTGVCEVLAEAGAVLVGGHTAEGPELSLGLSVNGLVEGERVLTKGGLAPGDRLVLTEPLGTGVIFAADMRAEAEAAWVEAALATMLRSSAAAAACLAAHGASACTDVTGFGLAGHLVEMLRASALDARVAVDAVPLLPGVAELVAAGVRSSLEPANRAFAAQVDAGGLPDAGVPALAALYDPQTAGGLLAGVPAARAEACVAALRALGYAEAAVIGEVLAPAGGTAWGRIRLEPLRSPPSGGCRGRRP